MIARFFRVIIHSIALAAVVTPLYLNVYTVPAGHYGLLRESSMGWQLPPLKSGRHWLWTGFVPDKWQLVTLPIDPPPTEITFRQGLRLTEVLNLGDLFRIRLKLRVAYHTPPDSLSVWLRLTGGDPQAIPAFMQERLTAILRSKLGAIYQSDNDIPKLETALRQYLLRGEKSEFAQDWSNVMREENTQLLDLINWDLLEIFVPDAATYEIQTRNMTEIFTARRKSLTENILADSRVYERRQFNMAELEHLQQIRELLQKNPALLKYLKYDRLSRSGQPITIVEAPSQSPSNERPAREGEVAPLTP